MGLESCCDGEDYALNNIGDFYIYGPGVDKKYLTAKQYCQRAANPDSTQNEILFSKRSLQWLNHRNLWRKKINDLSTIVENNLSLGIWICVFI